MKNRDKLYIDIAKRIAKESYATRLKVGAVLVKDNNIISFGWNGMPPGFDNTCETDNNETREEVIHSEQNCYAKLAKSGTPCSGATMYLTHSPCFNCAKLIIQSGTIRVVYIDVYRQDSAISFLKVAGVQVDQFIEE